jgi:hypothetical protein
MESRNRFAWSKVNPLKTVYRLRDYPAVAGLAVVFLFSSLAQRGLENVWVLYTGYRFGWNELDNGLTLGLVGLMAAIVQGGLVAPIISHLGERRALVVGLLISTTRVCRLRARAEWLDGVANHRLWGLRRCDRARDTVDDRGHGSVFRSGKSARAH